MALLAIGAAFAPLSEKPVASQEPPALQLGEDIQLPPKPRYPRLDSHLNLLVDQFGLAAPQSVASEISLRRGDSVAVTIRPSADVSTVLKLLKQNGVAVANSGEDYVEAYVPIPLLAALSQQDGVLRVETIVPPQPAVTSEGTTIHGSPIWNTGGFTGTGVKVGIIDVGFLGYSGLMGTELPSTVVARCYTEIGAFTSTLTDCQTETNHGTAVAEAVVDIAPNVSIYLANPISTGDLKATAAWMVSQGVKVVNHSVEWIWDGPGDGTSPFSNSPLKTVDAAVAGGALWVNAAGNSAKDNWYGDYNDSDADGWMRFALSGSTEVEANSVQLSAGETLNAQARWKDSWGNAATDLDLYLYNSNLTTIVASSNNLQEGGLWPYPMERLSFTASASGTYYLSIFGWSGPVPQWVQLDSFTGQDLGYAVVTTSIGNPAESANTGLLAVGAARWSTTSTIEYFSSQGPTTDGRVKPDIVGVDGGDSATSGMWHGTSQASPHVAGLAALVLSRFPGFTSVQVADYLKKNALPRSAVPNNTWGYGLAQLPLLPPGSPTGVVAVAGNSGATVTWSAPSSDGGSAITGYTVTSNPGSLAAVVNGTTLSATVTGLTNGTSYTFTVTATNAVGTSPPSGASNAATPQGAPGAPTNVVAVAGNSGATVTWSAPSSDGGSPILEYIVTSNPGGLTAVVNGATLSTTVTGLTNGTSYTFTVKAANAVGQGAASAPSDAVTPATVPSKPTNVVAVAGNSGATVTWSAPSSDGGNAIYQYTVTSNPDSLTASVNGATLSTTVLWLTNGTAYTFTVTATNAVGTSPPSDPSAAVIPHAPIVVPALSSWSLGVLVLALGAALWGLQVARLARKSR